MATDTREPRTAAPPPQDPFSLVHGVLPRWASLAVLAGSVLLALVVTLPLQGFNLAWIAVLTFFAYIVAIYVISRAVEGKRKATDRLVTGLVYSAFTLATLPLISVIWSVLQNGIPRLTADFASTSMRGVSGINDIAYVNGEAPFIGGAYHAIVGTLIITALATLISVPIGLLSAVYLVEYGKGRLARAITFFVDVMTGIPSIVAGLFAAALFALILGPAARFGFIGSVALCVLMIPVVVRASEEMLKLVPNELREASYALGIPKWLTILKVVIPTAISGIAAGVTLAIARVAGETAPLLVTVGFTASINTNPFEGSMATLPTYIYQQALRPLAPQEPAPSIDRAWAGALILIIFVMALNLGARLIARTFAPKTSR